MVSAPQPPVVRTKLISPGLPTNFVSRDRLTRQIDRGRRRRVTLLTAPAGYGKSMAVLDWTISRSRGDVNGPPVAWLSLDVHDNSPVRFWRHVVAALGDLHPGIGAESSEWFEELGHGDPLLFTGSLLNEVSDAARDLILVLDDVHVIHEATVLEQLEYVIHHLPACLHLVMISRVDPNLRLHRLAAAGELTEIRAEDLRMTRDEIESFVSSRLDDVDGDVIPHVARRTEGWPVAVQLMTVRLTQSNDPTEYLAATLHEVRPIADYLVTEVLENLPARLRTFVREISVLDGFSDEVADELLEHTDSRSMIQDVIDRELFIVRSSDDDRWFRFHHLFADVVRSELHFNDRERWFALHRRAADLLARRGTLDEALDHACAGEDWDFVVSHALDAVMKFANQGDVHRFRRWLTAVPEEYVAGDATTTVLVGLAHVFSLERDAGRARFEQAIDLADSHDQDDEMRPGLSARAFLALVAGYGSDMSAWRKEGELALAAIPEADGTFGAHLARSFACAQLAAALAWGGAIDVACDVAGRALAITSKLDFSPPRALAFGASALAAIAKGKIADARADLGQLSKIIDGNDFEHLAHGAIRDEVQGRLAWEVGDLDDALDSLNRTWDTPRLRPLARPGVASMLSRSYLALGDRSGAERWLANAEVALEAVANHPFGQLDVLRAELALATSAPDSGPDADLGERLRAVGQQLHGDAAALAAVAAWRADRGDPPSLPPSIADVAELGPRAAIEWSLCAAMCTAEDESRRQYLLDSLELARNSELTGSLREWGGELADLIATYAPRHVDLGVTPAVERQDGGAVASLQRVNGVLIEPLSTRELRVLAELPSGDSYQDIAGRLFVSHNTVKSHVKAVYRKLDVHSRVAAVNRAFQLGLLQAPGLDAPNHPTPLPSIT